MKMMMMIFCLFIICILNVVVLMRAMQNVVCGTKNMWVRRSDPLCLTECFQSSVAFLWRNYIAIVLFTSFWRTKWVNKLFRFYSVCYNRNRSIIQCSINICMLTALRAYTHTYHDYTYCHRTGRKSVYAFN